MSNDRDLKAIASGGLLTILGLAFTNFCSFAFMAIIARTIGVDQFGIFILGYSIFGIAAAVSLMGMDNAVLRFISPMHEVGNLLVSQFIFKRITSYCVIASILVSMILYFSAEFIASAVFNKYDAVETIKYFSFCILPFVLSVLCYKALQSMKRVKQQVMARNFIEPGVKIIGALALSAIPVYVGWHYAVYVLFAAFIFAIIYGLVQINKIIPLASDNQVDGWSDSKMFRYSSPLFLTAIISMGLFRLDVLFLGRHGSLEEVGYYGAAFQLASIGVFALTAASLVFSPYIASGYQNNQHDRVNSLFKVVCRWVLILSLPFLGIVVLYPSQILTLYGVEYQQASNVLIILVAGTTIANFSGLSSAVLEMGGYSKTVLFNSLVTCVIAFISCYTLVPVYGAIGAALAAAFAIISLAILRFIQVYRLEKISPVSISMIKPIFATFVTVMIMIAINHWFYMPNNWVGVMPMAAIFMVIFISCMCFLGWSDEDRFVFEVIANKIVN